MNTNTDTPEKQTSEALAVGCSDLLCSFISKYFSNNFYWVNAENFEKIQEIAFSVGIKWHTGDNTVTPFERWPHKNLVAFKHKGLQAVDSWYPNYTYGEPVDFAKMVSAYEYYLHNSILDGQS